MGKREQQHIQIKNDNGDTLTYNKLKEMMGPNVKIEHLGNGDVKMTTIEEKIVNRRELKVSLSVRSQFIQIYLGFYERLIATDNASAHQAMLTYILKYEMDKENNFEVNADFYTRFDSYMKTLGREPYNERYAKRVFTELLDDEFFIRHSRGKYQVNPVGFWSGSKKGREDSIMQLAEKKMIELPIKIKEKNTKIGQRRDNGDVY